MSDDIDWTGIDAIRADYDLRDKVSVDLRVMSANNQLGLIHQTIHEMILKFNHTDEDDSQLKTLYTEEARAYRYLASIISQVVEELS